MLGAGKSVTEMSLVERIKRFGLGEIAEDFFVFDCCSPRDKAGPPQLNKERIFGRRTTMLEAPEPAVDVNDPLRTARVAEPPLDDQAPNVVSGAPPETQASQERIEPFHDTATNEEVARVSPQQVLAMRDGKARLASFRAWPHTEEELPNCRPQRLAGAGFYHDPDADYKDRVSCAFCHLSLGDWQPEHDPVEAHVQLSPECPLLVQFGMLRGSLQKKIEPELSGSTWRVADKQEGEVYIKTTSPSQHVYFHNCHKGTAPMVCVVHGDLQSITMEKCTGVTLTVFAQCKSIVIRDCEHIEIASEMPSQILIERTLGCRVEVGCSDLSSLAIVSDKSSAVVLQTLTGVTIIHPPGAPGQVTRRSTTQVIDGQVQTRMDREGEEEL